jgi:hypothetical protein
MSRPWYWLAAAAVLGGCGVESVAPENGSGGRFSVRVGQELELKLQTIGPGEYVSPPVLSSSALRFLNVQLIGPPVPAGLTQGFRFRGVGTGRTIVEFHHSGEGRTVQDTVDVF